MTTTTPLVPVTSDACDVFHADAGRVADVRAAMPEPLKVERLAETFKALGDPTRVRMLSALSRAELCVCDLATLLGATESAISHQLRLLRSLRIVRARCGPLSANAPDTRGGARAGAGITSASRSICSCGASRSSAMTSVGWCSSRRMQRSTS